MKKTPVNLGRSNPGHDSGHKRGKLRGHLRKIHGFHANSPLGHHNNVRTQPEIVLMKPEKFPHQTLDPIATHRLANFPAHRQPKTPGLSGIFPFEHKESEAL